MGLVFTVTDNSFDSEVLEETKTVLVEFGATWCGPCKKQLPILEDLAKELQDVVKVVKIDVDEAPENTKFFDIRSLPTLLLFKNGSVVSTRTGLNSKESLKQMIEGV